MNIRKGDTVLVIAGNSKYHGKRGRVLAMYPKKQRILVEGVNIIKRHTKAQKNNQQGGIVDKEAPIHITNVMPWCESASKPSKITMKRLEDGSRVRIYKINGETVKNKE